MYHPVKPEDFAERMIEITVWDFDRIGASEFLGEVSCRFWSLIFFRNLGGH